MTMHLKNYIVLLSFVLIVSCGSSSGGGNPTQPHESGQGEASPEEIKNREPGSKEGKTDLVSEKKEELKKEQTKKPTKESQVPVKIETPTTNEVPGENPGETPSEVPTEIHSDTMLHLFANEDAARVFHRSLVKALNQSSDRSPFAAGSAFFEALKAAAFVSTDENQKITFVKFSAEHNIWTLTEDDFITLLKNTEL